MADKLTPQQKLAVENRGGRLLVSAAAGSGKTKVLVDRLMRYIQDPVDPANIDDFLIITYTRAAASELRGKIAAKLSEKISEEPNNRHLQRQMQRLYLASISTVHSFCTEVLREYAYRLDISADFYMAEEQECRSVRQRAMDKVLQDAYEKISEDSQLQAFLDTEGLGRSDSMIPAIIEKIYDSSRCHLDPDSWLEKCVEDAKAEGLTDASQTVWGKSLMESFLRWVEQFAQIYDRCALAADEMESQEKAAATLRGCAERLRYLGSSTTWDQIYQRRNVDFGRLTFNNKTDDHSVSDPIRAVLKKRKEEFKTRIELFSNDSKQILEELNRVVPAAEGLTKLTRAFAKSYAEAKRSRRMLDFSDLEHKALDLLMGKQRQNPTALAKEIGQRYREVLVDEYQDSNAVQDSIFCSITEERQNLFMVGDVKQAIYRFRLADPGIFLEKYAAYVPALEAQPFEGRKVLLSSNFRSGGGVLQAVNDVFEECMTDQVGGLNYGPEEALSEGVPHIPLKESDVVLHCLEVEHDSYIEEAEFVADQIQHLIDGTHYVRQGEDLRPVRPEDITILLRSPGSVGMEYRQELEKRGIPTVMEKGADLLLAEEVETLRSLLQIISNPRQDIPLIAVLASPLFGFTGDELASLRREDKKSSIYDCLLASTDKKAESFLQCLQQMREAARLHPLPRLMEIILRKTRAEEIYGAMADGVSRMANLRAFFQTAVSFRGGELERFLDHLAASEEKGLKRPEDISAGAVQISSIHMSKGLEYPIVFLCGLARGFMTKDLYEQVLCHQDLGLGLNCVDEPRRIRYPSVSKHAIVWKLKRELISEELRILYVAMTRARDRLIMTYSSANLEKELQEMVMKRDLMSRDMIIENVSSMGDWILYSALGRTDAGSLFAIAGRPRVLRCPKTPWKITYEKTCAQTEGPELQWKENNKKLPEDILARLRRNYSFRYNYEKVVQIPSKQTVTQRKGRVKDAEAAELAQKTDKPLRNWRKPAFLEQTADGKEYGNALHAIMQYVDYLACKSEEGVRQEIQRLVVQQYITPRQGEMVSARKIAAFFSTEFGKKLCAGGSVLREFKFSILDDASDSEELSGEKVLLQGVVDCALLEDDGITVVDYKTDYVTEQTLQAVVDRYSAQVETYAQVLERIMEKPVKAKGLYFFHLDRIVWLG